jgi:hypothetical protein
MRHQVAASGFRSWSISVLAVAATIAGVMGACDAGGGASSANDDGGGASSSGAAGAGGDIFTGNGGSAGSGASTGGGCASETIQADGLPLDMAIMFDKSGSMDESVTGGTKWQLVTSALNDFMALPESAGIGVGIQFFPLEGNACPLQCFTTADCGAACGSCLGAFMGFPGFCTNAGSDNCTVADYQVPEVPIALLPGVQPAISMALTNNSPTGGTPTGVALQGAINYASSHAMANSNHVVIVVLVTDGLPTSCDPSDIPGIQAIAAAGVSGTPSILTFVIGVGDALTNLHAIAQSGGSTQAFIVDTAADVEQQFLDALEAIKGSVLGCTFTIPEPTMGEPDFNKVNVDYTPGGGGAAETIPRVDGPGDCPAMGDGWYYNDPANPTQIILCPYTCDRVSADDMGRVDIVLGCATMIE